MVMDVPEPSNKIEVGPPIIFLNSVGCLPSIPQANINCLPLSELGPAY